MRGKIYIFAAIMAAAMAARAQTAPGPGLDMRVELKVSMEGRTAQAAANDAVRQAKDRAIKDYIESAVPAELLKGRDEDIKAILAERDRYVMSYEVSESKVEGQWLILSLWVKLDQPGLDAALKRAELTPARGMPRTFVVVMGTVGDRPQVSGWDRARGSEFRLNDCEQLIAREFENFGFEVARPSASGPSIIPSQVVAPEGPEEKALVFKELREEFQAGVLVIGLLSTTPGLEGSRPGTYEISLKVAAADTATETVTYSDQTSGRFTLAAPPDRAKVFTELCAPAAVSAVQAAFKTLTPAFAPGEKREISVVVTGVNSYFQMKEIERKLREESPGCERVTLSRLSPGEVEFMVETTADAAAVANWLSTNRFEGLTLAGEAQDEGHVTAQATEAAMPPPPPGTAPGGTAAAPGPDHGNTAETTPAPE